MKRIFFFGVTSSRRRDTCCPDMRLLLDESIKTTPESVGDWGIVCGGRAELAQNHAKASGNSDAGWGESDHNIMKGPQMYSPAADIAPYCPIKKDYIWNAPDRWAALHDHIRVTAERLGIKVKCGVALKSGKKDNPHMVISYR